MLTITLIWQSINLLIIHLVVTKWGLIYIDSELLREGNQQLLDNLEEGVIILDETNLDILFKNKAATRISLKQDLEDSML